jgi:RimJ/RimL family protein N-acetyltransferase
VAEVVAQTERLRLRGWTPEDAEPFYSALNTPAVMRWLGGPQTPEVWAEGVERLLGYQRDFGHTFWIVERLADGQLLGFCGLKRVNAPGAPMPGAMEVGWRLREEAWGQGFAREAAAASLDLAFGRFGADEVVALTVQGNTGSWGLMERLGMRRRSDLQYDDPRFPSPSDLNPTIVYSVSAAEWSARRASV